MLISSGNWKFVGLKIMHLDFFGCTLNPLALYQDDSLISSVFTDETKFSKLESDLKLSRTVLESNIQSQKVTGLGPNLMNLS